MAGSSKQPNTLPSSFKFLFPLLSDAFCKWTICDSDFAFALRRYCLRPYLPQYLSLRQTRTQIPTQKHRGTRTMRHFRGQSTLSTLTVNRRNRIYARAMLLRAVETQDIRVGMWLACFNWISESNPEFQVLPKWIFMRGLSKHEWLCWLLPCWKQLRRSRQCRVSLNCYCISCNSNPDCLCSTATTTAAIYCHGLCSA